MTRVDGLDVDPVADSSSRGRVPAPAGSPCWEIHYYTQLDRVFSPSYEVFDIRIQEQIRIKTFFSLK